MKRILPNLAITLLTLIVFTGHSESFAALRLSGIFSDHMILQRDRSVTVWGLAEAGQQITIRFAGQSVTATAEDNGNWHARLTPLEWNANGRAIVVQSGDASLSINDVLVGDVWHASGQSNMAMTMGAVSRKLESAKQDIKAAALASIRFRRVKEDESRKPMNDIPEGTGWTVCSADTVAGFSAAAFYFARILHREVGVPVGIIDSSRGGTPIEPFIPREAFTSHPTLRRELELGDLEDLTGIWKLPGGVRARDTNWLPGRLFHSRIAPITRFAVRGVIWYQGESNCGDGEDPRDYRHKMRALINGWRSAIGEERLPFYFVQLPGSGAGVGWPYLREQQRLSADQPHSGMVVTIDLLDDDIHPVNKMDVGERLGRWALAVEYGMDIAPSGPLFLQADIRGETVTVHFSHTEGGLMIATKTGLADPKETPQKELSHFELADRTGRWHPAQAVIRGKTVAVRSKDLPKPAAVRYAYAVNPQNCNLYNRVGLPASPFCSNPDLLRYKPEIPAK